MTARLRLTVLAGLMLALPTAHSLAQDWGAAVQGAPAEEATPCVSKQAKAAIKARLTFLADSLEQAGVLPAARAGVSATMLSWPLGLTDSLRTGDYSYYGINYYVDHNPASPGVQDWNCLDHTYDEHEGTDFFLWPFSWNKMDSGEVKVVAAAPGVIIDRTDGFVDRNCTQSATTNWNAVYVRHADGSIAWYGHMKAGTVTAKPVGASVDRGEYLGLVGSSGRSAGPHLHLQVFNPGGSDADPWEGPCNARDSIRWESPRPYLDPAVNSLRTHSTRVRWGTCPNQDVINEKREFARGDSIFCYTYLRDIQPTDFIQWQILDSTGNVFHQRSDTWTQQYFARAFWFFWFRFGPNAAAGPYTFRAIYKGKTYDRPFRLARATSVRQAPEYPRAAIRPAGPGGAILSLGAPARGAFTASLYDLSGRPVRRYVVAAGTEEARLDLSGLAAGCYLLRMPGMAVKVVRP